MSFFSKLFQGKKSGGDSTDLVKSAVMLDEDLYWKIVGESLQNSKDQDSQEQFLINRLKQLSPTEMIGFRLRTDKLLYDTYTSDMWCAAYIMNGGCSDDSFEYFRCWVISRGKDVYYNAKASPDSLINQLDEESDLYDFEAFWYVALEAFEAKTSKDLYEYIDNDNFQFTEGNYPGIDFTWKEEEPETLKAICPNLYEAKWA